VTTPKAGDPAPSFTSVNENGKAVSLAEYLGRWVVLFFYPKDDTPG
jgi:peroxiredoxin Q/BCP